MIILRSLFVFDLSAVLIMIIIASLSRRYGEALKIRPYYRLFYLTAAMVGAAAVMDAIWHADQQHTLAAVAMGLRAVAALIAFAVCLPYWNWIFIEYFKPKR